jgi:mono/diheme cytochrome c family protein
MLRVFAVGLLAIGSALALPLAAQEAKLTLKEGAGREKVLVSCGSCHSVDYVPMNSPFLDRAGWEGSVNKMIKTFGAPISAEDASAIVSYLADNYGRKTEAVVKK